MYKFHFANFFKGLVAAATLFIILSFSVRYIHNHTHAYSTFIHRVRRSLSSFLHCLFAQWDKPLWDTDPRFELGTAIRQASALPTELRCTLQQPSYAAPYQYSTMCKLHCILLRYAAPWGAMSSEQRNTLCEQRCALWAAVHYDLWATLHPEWSTMQLWAKLHTNPADLDQVVSISHIFYTAGPDHHSLPPGPKCEFCNYLKEAI